MTGGNENQEVLLPPKPTEPEDSECCGTGCSPCVFDIYKNQLKRWEKECEDIVLRGHAKLPKNAETPSTFLTPEKYLPFIVTKLHQESTTTNIYSFSNENCTSSSLFRESEFPIKIGQHVLIRLENISKQYTILRIDKKEKCFDILIKVYSTGLLTSLIGTLNTGDCVEMRGPFGNPFVYHRNSKTDIFILAAGTGIAPMYRIIENILNDEEDNTKLKLMFTCKNLAEVPLTVKFKEWSSYWNFEALFYLSQINSLEASLPKNGVPYYGMKNYYKRIDLVEIKEQIKHCDISKALFLICGTKSFDKDMINYLQKIDVNSENIVVF